MELWKSDGTEAGTVMVRDIDPGHRTLKSDGTGRGHGDVRGHPAGAASSSPSFLFNVKGKILFLANDGVNGRELWASDGTAGGTNLVKNIDPSTTDFSGPQNMTGLSDSVVFGATDGVTGVELWKSNGTAVGTLLVQDIYLGSSSSSPSQMTQSANQMFFSADNGVYGRELWVAPLAAVSVSLEEQIDQLLVMLNTSLASGCGTSNALANWLQSARQAISLGNGKGNLTSARAHLLNFIARLEQLTGTGAVSPAVAAPLLQGARDILEQIEGNRPVRTPVETGESDEPVIVP